LHEPEIHVKKNKTQSNFKKCKTSPFSAYILFYLNIGRISALISDLPIKTACKLFFFAPLFFFNPTGLPASGWLCRHPVKALMFARLSQGFGGQAQLM